MSPLEAYLDELRTVLGDRLPPAVHAARLREARAHLLASAQDVGEAEAVRRFGPLRAVANGLVRAHRGYDEKSVWSLALPLTTAFLGMGVGSLFLRAVVPATRSFDDLGPKIMLLFVIAFAFRAAQTRRWIAGPMAVAHGLGALLIMLLNHAVRRSGAWSFGEALPYIFGIAAFGAAWLLLNVAALGMGGLLDLRPARRVR